MPWQTPTLRKVREMVRDDITASLYGAAFIGNNVLRVVADAMAGLAHHVLRYIDWLALQLLPDTAETEWLDRHGDIWLVNADGTVGRKVASYATGTVTMTGIAGVVVPMATQLVGGAGVRYETTQLAIIGEGLTDVPVRAIDAGKAGNDAETLSFVTVIPNVDGAADVVELTGGTDIENDIDLRIRVLERIRQPPMGGAVHDYVRWAKAVNGVTRSWAASEMGPGTITVRFLMDDLRADDDGWPTYNDIQAVTNYIDTVRPVTTKDFWVLAPIKQRIDCYITGLTPDTPEVRAEIEESLRAMLLQFAAPGQTIYASWKSYAILNAPSVVSFQLINTLDDQMETVGHMAVLGDIVYGV
jgi:uncharacterized phage protein gp47/JayE